jgi:hypothetical protein
MKRLLLLTAIVLASCSDDKAVNLGVNDHAKTAFTSLECVDKKDLDFGIRIDVDLDKEIADIWVIGANDRWLGKDVIVSENTLVIRPDLGLSIAISRTDLLAQIQITGNGENSSMDMQCQVLARAHEDRLL